MALAIDASTPAAKHSANNTTPALTSNSFSPPAGSVIFVFWSGNDDPNNVGQPNAPSITDSLGSHLTWTQTDWSRAADTSNVGNGQAAIWWANCPSSQTNMTVTVTNGDAGGAAADGHIRPVVFTGADTTQNGAHGKGGGTSQTGTATYTSTRAGSQGFIVFCDWNASSSHPTVQSGCTEDSWTTLATQSTGWTIRETSTVGSSGSSVTIGASAPTVEGRYAYVEVLPAVTATSASSAPLTVSALRRPTPAGSSLVLGSIAVSRDFQQPADVIGAPPRAPGQVGSAIVLASRAVSRDEQPPALVVGAPPGMPGQRGSAVVLSSQSPSRDFQQPADVIGAVVRPPVTGSVLVLSSRADPPAPTDTPPPATVLAAVRPPRPAGSVAVLGSVAPSLDAQPDAVVVAAPGVWPARPGSAVTVRSITDQPAAPPAVLFVPAPLLPPRVGVSVLSRGPVPPFVAAAGTPTATLVAAPVFTRRLVAAPVLVAAGAPCDCTTHRPNTGTVTRPNAGTVAYGGSTVTRPDTGIITRPDTGIVEDPCC